MNDLEVLVEQYNQEEGWPKFELFTCDNCGPSIWANNGESLEETSGGECINCHDPHY